MTSTPAPPDPIAIVGLALRFPGAETLAEFWDLLAAGRVTIAELPAQRRAAGFPADRRFWGGFVAAADGFDPLFFGISAREANRIDPQQRFLLETAWNALEDAAIAPSRLSSREVGVFMGACHWDYLEMQARAQPPLEAHMATGISQAVLSNRVSYLFDFTGPSVTNDTACSSALVAIEQAVQALRAGSCTLALAGGANLIWSPDHFLAFAKAGMLSRTGASRAFDARADGYVRGEGAAVVVLKPLAQAVADGDPIHAVIREVASNHGGHSAGLTVTNPTEQAALIVKVLSRAGVSPETLGYVEAHGTGTPVGDPIEVRGLKTALETLYDRAGLEPVVGATRIGSVKNNIGHLEGAAGMAGLAKVVAALQRRQIPPTAGFEHPNPLLRLEGSALRVADRLEDWPAPVGAPRRAGVSSFGFGGTNAHALIEDYGPAPATPAAVSPAGWPILLSARSANALDRRVADLADWLERNPQADPGAIAASLILGREAMAHRVAILARDPAGLARHLAALRAGGPLPEGVWRGQVEEESPAPEALVTDLAGRLCAWVGGAQVDWAAQLAALPTAAPRLHLPGYVFDRTSHWFEPLAAPEAVPEAVPPSQPDAGLRFENLPEGAVLHVGAAHPYLAQHQIGGAAILPGVVTLSYVARAFAPAQGGFAVLRDVVWQRPARATAQGVTLTIRRSGAAGFTVEDAQAQIVARGRLAGPEPQAEAQPSAETGAEAGPDLGLPYDRLIAAGIAHGPAFRAVSAMALAAGQVVGRLDLPATAPLPETAAHPVLLDAALQTVVAALLPGEAPGVPFALERFEISEAVGRQAVSLCRRRADGRHDVSVQAAGRQMARLTGLATRPVAASGAQAVVVAQRAGQRPPDPVPDALQQALSAHRVEDFLLIGQGVERQNLLAIPAAQIRAEEAQSLHDGLWQVLSTLREWMRDAPLRGLWLRPGGSAFGAAALPLVRSLALEAGGVPVALLEARDGFAAVPRGTALRDDLAGAVVLVTGGGGGIGRAMAQALHQRGAKAVILAGRTPPAQSDFPFVVCDVTDRASLRRALGQILQEHGRLDGMIHSAGWLEDGLARSKDRAAFDRVLSPKIDGLLTLEAETAALPLRFFLVNGSVAAVHGAVGQSDYAAANAYAERFMAQRAARVAQGAGSGRSLCIGWTLWAEGGMQVSDRVTRGMAQRMGTEPLPTQAALGVLLDVLDGALPPRIVAGYGDAARFLRFLDQGDQAALPQPSQPEMEPRATAPEASPPSDLAPDLRPALLERLAQMLAETLGMEATALRPGAAFERYGFDSLLAVEMVEKLEKWLGVELSATLFFETLNLNGVADHLLRTCPQALAAQLHSAPPQATAPPPAQSPPEPIPPAPAVQTRPRGRDIAVIGLAGRYPGAPTLAQFWDNLATGRHHFTPIPQDRWPHQDIYFPEREVLGKSTIRTGGFLADIDKFDPRYFNISQADAECMSPEVRLLLECAVETFEQAGYSRETLQAEIGGDVGVLVGTMSNHYNLYGVQNMLTRGVRASGSYTGTMPNMISYFYGLTGPSIFVDTMCSASLTALDLAVRLLREGQCRMVLAGGVNLLLHPFNLISSSQEHFTSNRAEVIRSFGLGADGTILGEGVGTALLRPLADAERGGDLIQAVITGTAMANAGPRNGFTVPSPAMQARAVRGALADAGRTPAEISYIETHGSGTKLGDPIEIAALREVYGATGDVALGSVKSNIAHLLAAAGIAGFTKLVLQLRHGQIAPSLHSEQINPAIAFDKTPFTVNQSLRDWVAGAAPRRAGITSIGAGGMNNHMIVEEYRAPVVPQAPPRPVVMPFSAMSPERLQLVLSRMLDWIERNPGADPQRVAHTLQRGRTALRCRAAVVVETLAELRALLGPMCAGQMAAAAYCADVMAAPPGQALPGTDARSLARNWVQGEAVDWAALWPSPPPRIELPAYPFEKLRCWYELDPEAPSVLRPEVFRRRLHPLILANRSSREGLRFQGRVRADDLLDYVSRREGAVWISPLLLADAALAALDLAGYPAQGLAGLDLAPDNLAGLGEIDLHVSASGGVEIRQADRVICRALALTKPEPDPSLPGAAALEPQTDPAPILAEAGIRHHPYPRGIGLFAATPEGRFAASILAAPHRQDHERGQMTLPPEAITALEDALLLAARAAGAPDWAGLTITGASGLTRGAALAPAVRLEGQLVPTAGGFEAEVALICAAGGVVARLGGLRLRSGAETQTALAAPAQTDMPQADTPHTETGRQDGQIALREIVAGLLKFDFEQVDIFTRFHDFGFDSIALAALTEAVNARFGAHLTPAVFYDVANIAQLSEQLGAPLARKPRAAPPAASPAPALAPMPPPAAANAPVAIIGMACRVPGADGAEAFADLLFSSRSGLGPMPASRYGTSDMARIAAAGLPPKGGFLADIARFDADFFQISPAEAEAADPQHRLMLETVWAALEDAALLPAHLTRSAPLPRDTGVFIGVSGNDYREMMQQAGVPVTGYTATGTSQAMLANRVSFLLDLTGPSAAIDTACSSSLVAVHRAVCALRSGHCAVAIAGGVNIALTPEGFLGPMQGGMLSPDGECRTFSARANGYVRGEGVGVVVLKPLGRALADGDPIHAVIHGSAENHGGRAGSITAPRVGAQAAVIAAAMAGIDPAAIGCVEAHGTGTELGDPVELDALNRAYADLAGDAGQSLAPGRILLSAVKPAIGHLEAAAGIAGLIKLVLCRTRGRVAANLLGTPLNPYLTFAKGPFRPVLAHQDWPADRPLAGVSSFGFGGVNAHVVIGPAPARVPAPGGAGPQLFVLSARSNTALRARADDLLRWLDRHAGAADLLPGIAATLQSGRAPMRVRAAFVADNLPGLRAALAALAAGQDFGGAKGEVAGRSLFDPEARAETAIPARADAATAAAWCRGAALQPIHAATPRLHLPVYPFEGAAHWFRRPPVAAAPAATAPVPPAPRRSLRPDLLDAFIDGRLDAAQTLSTLSEEVT